MFQWRARGGGGSPVRFPGRLFSAGSFLRPALHFLFPVTPRSPFSSFAVILKEGSCRPNLIFTFPFRPRPIPRSSVASTERDFGEAVAHLSLDPFKVKKERRLFPLILFEVISLFLVGPPTPTTRADQLARDYLFSQQPTGPVVGTKALESVPIRGGGYRCSLSFAPSSVFSLVGPRPPSWAYMIQDTGVGGFDLWSLSLHSGCFSSEP